MELTNYSMFKVKMQKEKEYVEVEADKEYTIKTLSAFGHEVNNLTQLEKLLTTNDYHHHPLSGSFYVKDCKEGDILGIEIVKIKELDNYQVLSKSAGIFPLTKEESKEFKNRLPKSYETTETEIITETGKIKKDMMMGILGITPKESFIKTGHGDNECGGNLDSPLINEKSITYFCSQIDGGGLYFGDVHSKQGYGEVSGIALESSAEITFKVHLIKKKNPLNSIIVKGIEPFSGEKCISFIGVSKEYGNLNEAVKNSYDNCLNYLSRKYNLSRNEMQEYVTLLGNVFVGQAYSKTAESTASITIKEVDLENCFGRSKG